MHLRHLLPLKLALLQLQLRQKLVNSSMEKNKHEKSIFQYSNIIFMSELLEWGRVRDSEVKPSDYFESKEYNAVVERVKDAAVERLRVDAHIASQPCKQTQPK